MNVEIKVSAEAAEPYAVIYTKEITEEVRHMAALIESRTVADSIAVTYDERIFVLRPEDVYMIRVENEKTVVYAKEKRYDSKKRLYELEAVLGNRFMRIAKATLINLRYLDYVEPAFNGLMLAVLKNGCKDYISRKYLPAFKKYLGL